MTSYLLEKVKPFCYQDLRAIISACEELLAQPGIFGGRIWLLPRWYYHALANDWQAILLLAEALRPEMVKAATYLGPIGRTSGIRWSMRKGFIGRLMFEDPDDRDPYTDRGARDHDILQHDQFWPDNLDVMTEEEWAREPRSVREGRSLAEARILKALYGTAIGAALRHPKEGSPIGCATIHTKSGHALTETQADACAEILVAGAVQLSYTVASEARLR